MPTIKAEDLKRATRKIPPEVAEEIARQAFGEEERQPPPGNHGFCSRCGTPLRQRNNYCERCGYEAQGRTPEPPPSTVGIRQAELGPAPDDVGWMGDAGDGEEPDVMPLDDMLVDDPYDGWRNWNRKYVKGKTRRPRRAESGGDDIAGIIGGMCIAGIIIAIYFAGIVLGPLFLLLGV